MEVQPVESVGYGILVCSLHAFQFTRSSPDAFYSSVFSVAKPELSVSCQWMYRRETGHVAVAALHRDDYVVHHDLRPLRSGLDFDGTDLNGGFRISVIWDIADNLCSVGREGFLEGRN